MIQLDHRTVDLTMNEVLESFYLDHNCCHYLKRNGLQTKTGVCGDRDKSEWHIVTKIIFLKKMTETKIIEPEMSA